METEDFAAGKRKQRELNNIPNRKRLALYLYNREEKTCCARTLLGWLKVFVYYIVFLVFVAAFFVALSLYATSGMDPKLPHESKLSMFKQSYPGITFISANYDGFYQSLIWYTSSGTEDAENRRGSGVYVNIIKKFLKGQSEACGGGKCAFSEKSLGPCGRPDYGYSGKKPCIFLKLGRLKGWRPQRFKRTPKDLPGQLKKFVNNTRNCLWVHCQGVTKIDKDNLGKMTYYPEPAFHEDYFPVKSNLHPVIGLHLEQVKNQSVIGLKCELFAENVPNYPNKYSDMLLYIG